MSCDLARFDPQFNPDEHPYLARRVHDLEEERLRQTAALTQMIADAGQDE